MNGKGNYWTFRDTTQLSDVMEPIIHLVRLFMSNFYKRMTLSSFFSSTNKQTKSSCEIVVFGVLSLPQGGLLASYKYQKRVDPHSRNKNDALDG